MGVAMRMDDRIERWMKLQDLHVLMTVVQEGSMGKAAGRLHTSQPNISRSISEMEHALGVRLLDRHRQGVEPTEFGRALLDCGVTVFDGLRQGLKNIEFLAHPAAGEVRIGSIIPLAASFVAAVVDRLSRRHPGIVFHLAATDAETLHRNLTDRSLDFAIIKRIGPFADQQFSIETLFHDLFVVVAGMKHPWARRRNIELAELTSQSWVLPPPETVAGAVLMDAFRASGLDYPRVSVVTLPTDVRASLLKPGRHLSIFPTSALRFMADRSGLKVLPIELPIAPLPVGIVTLKNRVLGPVAKLFIEHARAIAKPLERTPR